MSQFNEIYQFIGSWNFVVEHQKAPGLRCNRDYYIAVSLIVFTLGSYITNIIRGTCIPWGVFTSNMAEKAITSLLVIVTYLLPMILTVICYSRIIYVIRCKVR